MKRKLCSILGIVMASGMLMACGTSFQASENTVYVTKKGGVIGASIEDFNENYYDEEELKSYITQAVEDYVAAGGDGSVELRSFAVKEIKEHGRSAQLYLDYASYIDYAQFNGVTFYAGSVLQAQADGYEFEQDFQKVEKGSPAGKTDASDVMAAEDCRVVVIGEETALKVDGEIVYVSEGNVEVTGKNTAFVHYDIEQPDAQPAYIVYK